MDKTLKTSELLRLEESLKAELKSVEQPWISISNLLLECKNKEFWKPAYKSYSSWLNDFAVQNHITPSLLWKRQKAGAIYEEYSDYLKSQGLTPVEIDKKCSPEALEFAKKISGRDHKKLAQLVGEAASGQISRAGLERRWKAQRAERQRLGMKPVLTSRHDQLEELPEQRETKVTALDIVDALSDPAWLQTEFDFYESWSFKNARFYRLYSQLPLEEERLLLDIKDPRFRIDFQEFRTGREETSKRVRRMDYVIVENHTSEDPNFLKVHGFEIKVTKGDLDHDNKMGDYTKYCHTFWLVVPDDLKQEALDYVHPSWGVITVDLDGRIVVQQSATMNMNPEKIVQSLMTIIEKKIMEKK